MFHAFLLLQPHSAVASEHTAWILSVAVAAMYTLCAAELAKGSVS